ncbi:MAG: Malate dehydrogenase [Methanoregula sp. PtaU1.Bin051]|nr:MAG: Malate dehydrogenase [Methanoregula sp. PtaU1.Bin051]
MVRLAVIGVGRVGGEVAYLAASMGIVHELVLYDTAASLLRAQILDLEHAGLDMEISTDLNDIRSSDVCVFAAGLARDPSIKTRADLLSANLPVVRDCVRILKSYPGILITVTNPMDVNNCYLQKTAGIAKERCIGFGGQLDSARFALALRERGITGFPFVLGEHGEHQVPVFSTLSQTVPATVREEILSELRTASMEVIRGKGGTVFGPALHIVDLIRMLVKDRRELISCSCVLDGEYGFSGCSLGVPARIGSEGILRIEEWKLDNWEREQMESAARFVTDLCRKVAP